jgi:hypothetical protein
MQAFGIYLSEVIIRYEASGMSSSSECFSLTYEYLDKDEKPVKRVYEKCRRKSALTHSKNREYRDIKSIEQKEKMATKFHIEVFSENNWNPRNLFIAQVTHFNSLLIDHRH